MKSSCQAFIKGISWSVPGHSSISTPITEKGCYDSVEKFLGGLLGFDPPNLHDDTEASVLLWAVTVMVGFWHLNSHMSFEVGVTQITSWHREKVMGSKEYL